MNLIQILPEVIEESEKKYAELTATEFAVYEHVGTQERQLEYTDKENILAKGDNLDFMLFLMKYKNMAGKIDLIYVDPPFFSKSKYEALIKLPDGKTMSIPAYSDEWENDVKEYLSMLCIRLIAMRELLSDTGNIWVHLDWHASHYVKILMDYIFGYKNFVNEVAWVYKSGGSTKRRFARKHDTLLYYSKTSKYYFYPQKEKSYNRGFKPYRFKGVEEFKDDVGWYTMVNMKDVWNIDMVGRTSGERTGYATQKPETLLSRIIQSCSKPGDICADFFGGSGSFAAAATKSGRNWILCDGGDIATSISHKRLLDLGCVFNKYIPRASRPYESCSNVICERIDEDNININIEEIVTGSGQKINCEDDDCNYVFHWSIDTNFDGEVHQCNIMMNKSNKDSWLSKIVKAPRDAYISVVVTDIFGISYEYNTKI